MNNIVLSVFIVMGCFFSIPIINKAIHSSPKNNEITLKNVCIGILFLYSILYLIVTIFSREARYGYMYNLIPFRTLRNFIDFQGGWIHFVEVLYKSGVLEAIQLIHINKTSMTEVVQNILLFFPLGYLLPIIFEEKIKPFNIALIGMGLSLVTETLQFITKHGFFDVDDIIHNTMGIMAGYILYKIYLKKRIQSTNK